jgi:hypothetical protein
VGAKEDGFTSADLGGQDDGLVRHGEEIAHGSLAVTTSGIPKSDFQFLKRIPRYNGFIRSDERLRRWSGTEQGLATTGSSMRFTFADERRDRCSAGFKNLGV